MNPRTILFIHQSFPGQFGNLAAKLAAQGHRVYALAMTPAGTVPRVNIIRYAPIREPQPELPFLDKEIDVKLIRAESAYKLMKALKEKGLNPDVIYAHPGWGEAMYVRNVWPEARYIAYAEWFYNARGQEVNFDPGMPPLSEEEELRLTIKNTPFLQALSECDAAISPTFWQKSRYPAWAQEKISVIHEGLNINELARVQPRPLGIPSQGIKLKKGMPIVTYCARHLEPIRGFHYFMRSLPAILKGNPDAHVIVMGKDAGVENAGYGRDNPDGTTWRKAMEKELGDSVDWKRVHFLGFLEKKLYLALLKLSACHVYLTTPFILYWSFLEAAALGIPIVASATPPVLEFKNLGGIEFVPYNDTQDIANKVLNRLANIAPGFVQGNLEKLQDLDISKTIPAMEKVLLGGTRAKDRDSWVEDVIILEEEDF